MTLIIKDLTKKFDEHVAVNSLNIEIPKGEIFGFLGGNGAGKTTTFRMILGLLSKSSGSISWNGKPINYDVTDKIGYLPEERGLYAKMTVKEQVNFFAKLKNMKSKDAEKELQYWLERFNISEHLNKKVGELSKGNQQKIQLITAIIHKPELLILDEPFSGLDPVNVEMLKEAVLDMQKQGSSILFSSHRMEHVEELCQHICIMHKGVPVVQGDIAKIKSDFGKKNVVIIGDHDFDHLKEIEGVESIKKRKNAVTLKITSEEVSHVLFKEITKLGYVKKFAVEEPTLNDIFIAKVGAQHE
ncbi:MULTISPECIES: ABC transporter ATP-binding protein [Bacillus]|uniref:ABC transporter ATP-binding protein n=1 Tax=Bacillus TaxID=1386 RepID=UPI0004682F82|nr:MULTISPECIES: ABC transporter ATP-binding protein [Bacillus]MED1412573.1 ABC transporter ATP-binding protein [Bacillus paramycoides]MED1463763.1 ABC transporter ATP-binding protein [Bacillus paramycoides]MED1495360.1 ABC transporter ATP-binding protein [Bacillus paramycoides]